MLFVALASALGIWEAAYEQMSEAERIAEMNRLIAEW